LITRNFPSALFYKRLYFASELFEAALFQVMEIEPEQFLGVENSRRFAAIGEVEILEHLLLRKNLLVAMRPSEPHEVVEQGFGKITEIAIGEDRSRTVPL